MMMVPAAMGMGPMAAVAAAMAHFERLPRTGGGAGEVFGSGLSQRGGLDGAGGGDEGRGGGTGTEGGEERATVKHDELP